VPKREKNEIPQVLYEDEFLLVLNKPAGWVVNRSQTVKKETLQDWLERNFQFSIFNFQNCRSGIVHRLDKDTSGVLVVAKTPEVFENLQKQFKERRVGKRYLVLVHGNVQPPEGIIRAPIARSPFDRKKFGIFLGGREAETEYRLISKFKIPKSEKEEFSLLEVEPKTGRTHQIRVHLKYLGYPVVADEFYAGRKTCRADKRWCPRQFLHAYELSFIHPETGKKVKFSAPLPWQLKKVLEYLEKCEK
jgi:23S rRNA pseudouridine1911/1915/1917 synthase